MTPVPFRVRHVRRETHDVWTLELEPPGGRFPFAPGQFNMLYAFGSGEVPISISGDPDRPEVLTHTIRAVGAVTRAVCEIPRGGILGVRGPYGTGWPMAEADGRDVVVVAGGIGLAPLRPALFRLMSRRERFGRVAILYGARTPSDLIYVKELAKWRGRFDLEALVTVDAARNGWRGPVGTVTTLIPRSRFDAAHALAFVCGPEVMIRFTVAALLDRGVPRERIHVSMERNMKCGVGLCGHCQLGPEFVCKDGPVFPYPRVERLMKAREA